MVNINKPILRNHERLTQAQNVIELAKNISSNINQSSIPDREINYFDLNRKSSKGRFGGLLDFIYTHNLRSAETPPIWVSTWELENNQLAEYEDFPTKGHLATNGLLLSSLGHLIKFNIGIFEDYRVLNAQTIENPKHVENLLGKFAVKNSIDYSTL